MPDPTASLAAAQALGLATPQPSDFIHRGDDAITLNARHTADALLQARKTADELPVTIANATGVMDSAPDVPTGGGFADATGTREVFGFTEAGDFTEYTAGKIRGTVTPVLPGIVATEVDATTGITNHPDLTGWGGGFADATGTREVFGFTEAGDFTEYTATKIRTTLVHPAPRISVYGDSMTYGWYLELARHTGMPVAMFGEGGQTSARIAARQGGVRALLTLTGNAVPATGAVTVTAWTANPVAGSTGGPRTGSVAGVPGTLTWAPDATTPDDDRLGVMTFTRLAAGTAVPVAGPVEFVSDEESHNDGVLVLFPFTNDRGVGTPRPIPVERTVSNVTAMVARAEALVPRVLVLGSFPSAVARLGTPERADFDARRDAVRTAVRGHWLDPFTDYFMTDQAPADLGITLTAEDLDDRAAGLVPRSMRGDSIHLTDPAKKALGLWVARRMYDRGWIATVNP